MSQLISISARSRPRHRPYHRWSAEERGRYLDAFQRSGLSGVAFCREMDVPLATFALWKRDARRAAGASAPPVPRSRVAFARVKVVPLAASAPMAMGEPHTGMRLVVRGAAGHEAALDGVDSVTAVRLVALVLGRR
jgi:transposase-like protein